MLNLDILWVPYPLKLSGLCPEPPQNHQLMLSSTHCTSGMCYAGADAPILCFARLICFEKMPPLNPLCAPPKILPWLRACSVVDLNQELISEARVF